MGMATHIDRHEPDALQCLTAQSDRRPQTRPSFVSQQRWDSISLCLTVYRVAASQWSFLAGEANDTRQ